MGTVGGGTWGQEERPKTYATPRGHQFGTVIALGVPTGARGGAAAGHGVRKGCGGVPGAWGGELRAKSSPRIERIKGGARMREEGANTKGERKEDGDM